VQGERIAGVRLKRSERILPAHGAAREEVVVGGEEPHSRVRVEVPAADGNRDAQLRLEGPAVRAQVDELRLVVLSRRSLHGQARPPARSPTGAPGPPWGGGPRGRAA